MNHQKYTEISEECNRYGAKLIAVSKTKPVAKIKEFYDAGHRAFGENKVQELVDKKAQLPSDMEWHLIGHLQSNKVKYIAPFVALIHGVDNEKLLIEINRQGQKIGRKINILFQVYIAQEETKFGWSKEELIRFLQENKQQNLDYINICGLMGMATNTADLSQIRKEFKELKLLFDKLKQDFFDHEKDFNTLSMGMSSDYKIALEEGATMIRIGSTLFGE